MPNRGEHFRHRKQNRSNGPTVYRKEWLRTRHDKAETLGSSSKKSTEIKKLNIKWLVRKDELKR